MNDESKIEQQLRSHRPRSPRLDWDRLAAKQQPIPAVAVGFSAWHMAFAVAASWLLGAVVGGGYIFWSLATDNHAIEANHPADQTNTAALATTPDRAVTPGPVKMPAEEQPLNVGESAQNLFAHSDGFLPSNNIDWISDSPLSASSIRSPTTVGKLTNMRARSGSSVKSPQANSAADPAPSASPASDFQPAPLTNRHQLMQQYLNGDSHEIH